MSKLSHSFILLLRRTAQLIDLANDWLGRTISLLTILMVLTQFVLVALRYFFNISWIAVQESVLYMHAALFLLGAAYTYQKGGQVRVDIFYERLSPGAKALVNLCGILFLLLPMTVFIFYISWPYVADSWAIREGSHEAGGLSAVFLLKTNILFMAVLLGAQALSQLLREWLTWLDGATEA